MIRKYWYGLLAGLMLFPAADASVIVKDLYSVDRGVSSQRSDDRSKAIRSAMIEVLVRMSGNPNIAIQPTVAQALARGRRYVTRYRYSRKPVPADAPAGTRPGFSLHIVFDAQALEKILQRAGQPVWGMRRPATLVWVAIDNGSQRYLLDNSHDPGLRKLIVQQARRRGIPLLFPLMDLEDQRKLSFVTVWGGFLDEITRASSRYPAEAILVLRLRRDRAGKWQARWLLQNLSQVSNWTSTGGSLDGAIGTGVDGLGDILASRYVTRSNSHQASQVVLRVSGVRKTGDFARLVKYLESLGPMEDVDVSEIDKDEVVFHLRIRGDMAGLVRLLALGSIVVPYAVTVRPPGTGATPVTVTELRYRLQP
jgi:hypothetical protein